MTTKRKSELAGASRNRPSRWPFQLVAMVDEDTDKAVRELCAERNESLAETLRQVIDHGLAAMRVRARRGA